MSHPTAEYLPARHVQRKYQISRAALRSWAESGKVHALRTGGTGKRLYKLADIEQLLGEQQQKETEKFSACYARVSSAKPRGDLERQRAFLQQHYPNHRLFSDIGSGLNFKRAHFVALLDAVHAGLVREIVLTDKDRLCRFGADLVQWILDKAGTKLVVHHEADGPVPDEDSEDARARELSDDVSVITFFTARHHGQRAARTRKRRRDGDVGGTGHEEGPPSKKPVRETRSEPDAEDSGLSDA